MNGILALAYDWPVRTTLLLLIILSLAALLGVALTRRQGK